MDGLYLGIDLGTSATKAVLVEPGGKVVARSAAPHPETRAVGLGRVDPRPWGRSLTEACAGLGADRAKVTALSVAVHSPVALFLDSDGLPVAPGVGWDHPDLLAQCGTFGSLRTPAEAALIANPVQPSTMMALAWRVAITEQPDLVDRCVTLGLVGTWLGQFLTGRAAVDPTQASYLGLMASADGSHRWLDDLAGRYGVPTALLPEVLSSLSVLGPLREGTGRLLGLPAGVPVVVGAADTAAAAYLLGVDDCGAPLYTVGTTHVITTCRTAPETEPVALARSHVVPGRWLTHGATNGGDALALGARLLGYGNGRDAVRQMTTAAGLAEQREAETAPVYIPHIAPERGPLWLRRPATALVGLLPETVPRSAAWGVTEGVLFGTRLVLEMCMAGRPWRAGSILLTGNFSTGDAYPQLVADVFGRAVELVEESHLPALGAAAIAATATRGLSIPAPPTRRIAPREAWTETIARRWRLFAEQWTKTVGRPFPADVGEPGGRSLSADTLLNCPQ